MSASVPSLTEKAGGESPAPFYPALDGLRALAIVSVLIAHFFPERSPLQRAFHWGRFGVLLFFVLSGFLITGLLLRGREAMDTGRATRGSVFRAFVARRALRIAPIYYMVVLIGAWVNYAPIANYLPWHLTYTGNIALTYFNARLSQATHLWSLCVEEQFYLLWPLVVLSAPRRLLSTIAVGLVAFSFFWEVRGALQGQGFEETHLVLQGCMDALGLGALLAIVKGDERHESARAGALSLGAAVVGGPLFFFAQGFRYQVGITATERLTYRMPADLGLALVSLSLVYLAISSGPSWLRRFLTLAPVRFVGRISYGIYLYHLFLIPIGASLARRAERPEMARGATMFLVYSGVSIVLATLSWYALEAPINRLKRHFPFPPRADMETPTP